VTTHPDQPHRDLAGRITRLDELTRGRRREEIHVRQTDGVLLYVERLAYLAAIDAAASGLETARIVLAKAWQRLGRTCPIAAWCGRLICATGADRQGVNRWRWPR
jgi:hypothetical protein